ncbi:HAD family hydrolase [Actinoplanes derwentensis]|uniref:Phosphoglycolate phosphatase n=1 Tax=Actinoplanes derwentensis TaxID=113562 RepID=A0A1H2CTV1_9ACTN|nr:HAD family hydrolase [Actinoplanes derwentensis]GID89729.1 hydrolase [Actinoplanes derwentensis]SDT73612.1 phosphoglycolate phosphatase [Actinoplanes derwentensis]
MNLADLIDESSCLLIDFDGPICVVFAGRPAAAVADELRTVIRRYFAGELPSAIAELTADPLQILTAVARLQDQHLTHEVTQACRDAEVAAVESAVPTPGAAEVLQAAHASGRQVAIVSNNATDAISAYLQNHDLIRYAEGITARFDGMDPRLLKPHPFLLERGLTATGAARNGTAFIGDSVTDIEAGRAAGIPTIGYANKPGKHQRLTDAGADVVIDSMHDLANALHTAANPAR